MALVAADIWKKTLEYMKPAVSPLTFKTFLSPLIPVACTGDSFVLAARDEFSKLNLTPCIDLIQNALQDVTSIKFQPKIILQTEMDQYRALQTPQDYRTPAPLQVGYTPDKRLTPSNSASSPNRDGILNPEYTFETFVVGECNKPAHAACLAVAKHPGTYNPLFLYGGSGLGKTHLLHAIGNYVRQTQPQRRVLYVPCERFLNEFIAALGSNRIIPFQEKYRRCNMLLIDDIQFLESKEATQVEFFNTFNELYQSNVDIVLTCDKPPKSLASLEHRLITRFSSGLIMDVNKPEYETRYAILQQLAEQNRLILPPDVTQYLAENFPDSVRDLEGAFKTLIVYSTLTETINLQVAKQAVGKLISPIVRQITPEMILDMITRYFQVTLEQIRGKKKSKEQAMARQIAMYLLATHTNATYETIGNLLNKHHSTVIHGHNRIREELQQGNPEIVRMIQDLNGRIGVQVGTPAQSTDFPTNASSQARQGGEPHV